jgi:hypothetical protein
MVPKLKGSSKVQSSLFPLFFMHPALRKETENITMLARDSVHIYFNSIITNGFFAKCLA